MAITRLFSVYSAPNLSLNRYGTTIKLGSRNRIIRVVMCANNHISVNLHANIRSPDNQDYQMTIKNKVFEDKAAGIVCYKDQNGEIVCEGYDEGPRFHQQIPTLNITCNSSDSRDLEIIDMLQRCWVHVADEDESLNIADRGLKGCRAEGF